MKDEDKIKVENRNPAKAGQVLCFIFDSCNLILNYVFQIEIASSRLGFYFFGRQKSKQKTS